MRTDPEARNDRENPFQRKGTVMLSYDRPAPEALLSALRPGGFAHSLVEYGRSGQYALDLQLRGYEQKSGKSGGNWASLYCGLTKVIDLHYLPSRGFRLTVHPTWQTQGWDPIWSGYTKNGFSAAAWKEVEDYLERVIPVVGDRFLREGSVQSAISAFQSRNLTVIDREVAISFSNQAEKKRVTDSLEGPLLAAFEGPGPRWWTGRPATLGGECDALAVDTEGTLLAIEVKPAKASSTIPWSPVQVRQYSNLLARWAEETEDAAEIVDGMVGQRVELGLATQSAPSCCRPIQVRPIVALQRGVTGKVMDRLHQVQERLVDAGHDDPPLELYQVNLIGRLDPIA